MSHNAPNTRSIVHVGPTTHPSLHIRDARDAHIVLEAVRLNIIPLIMRRLSADEREHLSSGNVFVWEEAEFKGGLERWTDGRRWSQSRMRGDFLFYEEKMETTQEERDTKAARRAHRALNPLSVPPATSRRQDRPAKPDGLTKQTYSTQVYFPGQNQPRKWHIVAYFSGGDYTHLPVVQNYDYLRNLRVPDGIFVSNKGPYRRVEQSPCDLDEDGSSLYSASSSRPALPTRMRSSSFSAPPALSHPLPHHPISPPSPHINSPHATLPRLSTVVSMQNGPGPRSSQPHGSPAQPGSRSAHGHGQAYAPLSAEDRRVLNAFRVAL
ncbi:hypothetical protein EW146_g6001 [Bondarzewia mesenterica]|uniref:cAMP-independent regulatory protein pac2 n=1 Tax=Bondarzewia mesenterica TaxID=1095465 RepID=A0A4S4LPU4_9AGAM|nr:hypothetical protein EW146_g6001 [Bondarzewia mesenterica]